MANINPKTARAQSLWVEITPHLRLPRERTQTSVVLRLLLHVRNAIMFYS